MNNDLEKLFKNLPVFLQKPIFSHPFYDQLIEIVLDLGKRPEVRFCYGQEYLSQKVISWQDLDYTIKRINEFSDENRAGINSTLHRISCIRNRQFLIYGLTCRVGRVIFGALSIIRDLLELEKSILILGKPGVGKTTIIREIARILADEIKKRVIIIDTSNEIAGDSDVSHMVIGRSRRMQVLNAELQHQTMIEAIENHMPEIIIIDEISTELEVFASRTISEKGVQLIGTTHGSCLKNLIKNPSLSDLTGGVQYITISDEEAKKRKKRKTILERKAYSTFEIVVEINSLNSWTVHENAETATDLFLLNDHTFGQVRNFFFKKKVEIKCIQTKNSFLKEESAIISNQNWANYNKFFRQKLKSRKLHVYLYCLSTNVFREISEILDLKFTLTNDIDKADFVVGSKRHIKQNTFLKKFVKAKKISIYTFSDQSFYKILKFMQHL